MANVALVAGAIIAWTATIQWSDGMQESIPTITEDQCMSIPRWISSGIWKPIGRENEIIVSHRCEFKNSFAPGWDCIQNFNCQK